MFCGRPTAFANSGSMWIGLKSPEAPGVPVRDVLVGSHAQRGNVGAGLELGVCHQPPLTMLVQVPFTVVWPSWLVDSDSNT